MVPFAGEVVNSTKISNVVDIYNANTNDLFVESVGILLMAL